MSATPRALASLPPGVWLIAATSTVVMSGFGMIVPLLPVYGDKLGASAWELGVLMAAFFIGRLVAQMPAGIVADRYGRTVVIRLALLGYAATCWGYAAAAAPTWLIAFRLLQGLSSGFFAVAARSLLGDICEADCRGQAQGVYSASVNLGFCAGPIVGSYAASSFSLTTPFLAAAVLSTAALFLFSLSPFKSGRCTSGFSGLKADIPFRPSGYRRIQLLAGSNFSYVAGLSVIMALFPIAGKTQIPGGTLVVGAALSASGFFGLVLGPFTGRLSDIYGRTRLMAAGAALAAAQGTALLMTLNPWLIGIGFALGGIGAAGFVNSLHAAIGDLSSEQTRGAITGFIGLAGETGGIAGSLLAPWIWPLTDLRLPFGLQIVFTLVTLVLVALFGQRRSARPSQPAPRIEPLIPS